MPFLEKPAESRVFAFALLQPCRGHSRFVRTAVSPRLVTSPTAPFHHSTGTYWRTPAPSRSLGTLVSMASGAESFRHDRSRVGQPKGTDYGEFDRSEQALRVQQTTTGSAPLGFTDTQKERLLKMPLPSQRGLSLVLPADAAPVTDERLTVLRLTGGGARPHLVLGIETSCDDTAVAVVNSKGCILSEAVVKQDSIHARYGGVVPGLARQAHEQVIDELIERVLCEAFTCSQNEVWARSANGLDAVAVTMGPGLEICLRVGFRAAQRLLGRLKEASSAPGPVFISTHHLESHCLVPRLFGGYRPSFPFLVLLVSGGHCMLLLARDLGNFEVLGGTLDDSVGEAFDKIARLLGLDVGGGGGPALERLAREGNPNAFDFPIPLRKRPDCNFSFAGLKTAVRVAIERELERYGSRDETATLLQVNRQAAADIAASFQRVALEHLFEKTRRALLWCRTHEPDVQSLLVSGGVAANSVLRARFQQLASEIGWRLHDEEVERTAAWSTDPGAPAYDLKQAIIFPPLRYCTDNGVMVAWAGVERLLRLGDAAGEPDIDQIEVVARWPIGRRLAMDKLEQRLCA